MWRRKALSRAKWPEGVGQVILSETDTTNAEAARRAAFGHSDTWIMAEFQTAGRGRRGRAWVSPRGNFHATLLMRPTGGPAEAAQRSFIAALALDRALGRLTGVPQAFALKWPNDVLLNGCKCSGILLESLGQAQGVAYLAVGIGVNLIAAPSPDQIEARALQPVSLLEEIGLRIQPLDLLHELAVAFADYEALFVANGFAPIREAWLSRAARLGEEITARVGSETYVGVFETIDMSGALVLRTTEGRRTIPAADIYF